MRKRDSNRVLSLKTKAKVQSETGLIWPTTGLVQVFSMTFKREWCFYALQRPRLCTVGGPHCLNVTIRGLQMIILCIYFFTHAQVWWGWSWCWPAWCESARGPSCSPSPSRPSTDGYLDKDKCKSSLIKTIFTCLRCTWAADETAVLLPPPSGQTLIPSCPDTLIGTPLQNAPLPLRAVYILSSMQL